MSLKPNTLYWRICIALALLLTIITFTPLVIPVGVYRPTLLGMPYTLWMTILITILYVVLTFIGSRVHPGRKDEEV
jgi:hypothetical protein